MRVSYEWLKGMVDVPADPQGLITELVRTGTEVAAVERVGADITKVDYEIGRASCRERV